MWGFNTFKNPDIRYDKWGKPLFQGEPGKPDMDVWGGGRFTMIEVKDGYDSFSFNNFEQNKREYIAKYCTPAPYLVQVWIWLSLGNGYPNWKPEKQPRFTWLIPYQEWLKMEERVRPYQATLPYLAGRGYGLEMQAQKLDAVHIFERFVLQWEKGVWQLPHTHPFYKMYIEAEPVPFYQTEENPQNAKRFNDNRSRGSRRDVFGNLEYNFGLRRCFAGTTPEGTGIIFAGQHERSFKTFNVGFARFTHLNVESFEGRAMDFAT